MNLILPLALLNNSLIKSDALVAVSIRRRRIFIDLMTQMKMLLVIGIMKDVRIKEKKRIRFPKMKASTDITPSSSSSTSTSQINSSIEEIELFPEQENTLKDNKDENFGSKDYGNDDSPLYSLDEVQEIIAKKFYEAESSNENVNFALEIELDQQLLEKYNPVENENKLVEEKSSTSNHVYDISETCNIIELRQEKLSHYKKTFDTALVLYEREMNNDKFIENFDTLMKPIVRAIDECVQVLNAHKQQSTTESSNGKLSFWLC
ncbi:28712_t:CDS:2 [Dentiscutata erythropus]|uniref:28712_t:CDS:1 n=1 Tax=Dentiscutata erythropus TaxID=1348616 RepID=A0A9N8WCN5_9GLOM|nr:28712_t:CDS:2 [Dentiscutata erythropus]